jgi:hypothetical protein
MAKPSDIPELAPQLEKARQIYGAYMSEIKARMGFIHTVVQHVRANPKDPHGYINAESGILQLRTICECMGLAAIGLHSYAHPTEHLEQTWRVREIFRELKKINQDCFPRPWRFKGKDDNGLQFDVSEGDLPTLRGLLRCYGRCSHLLHRGEIAQAFDATWKFYDIDWLDEWGARIGRLLTQHAVMDLDGENSFVFIVGLNGGPNGEVTVAVAQGEGPSILNEPPREARFPGRADK